MNYEILALGDCNTSGDINFENNAYPERFAKKTGLRVKNCGYTMSTTKEMLHFYDEFFHKELQIILIQYGLVDSWKTFKYSPYILYYPDNFFRKIARKIVKKYKKIARKLSLNKIIGEKFVVSPKEYRQNIEKIILKSKNQKIFLIDTIPNKEKFRNKYIKEYNQILTDLSKKYSNCCKVEIYDEFEKNFDNYYLDSTHMNSLGYEVVTNKLVQKVQSC